MKKIKKPSKADMHIAATMKTYAHSSSSDMQRTAALTAYQVTLLESEITELEMKIKDAKATKAYHEATLRGLQQVIAGR